MYIPAVIVSSTNVLPVYPNSSSRGSVRNGFSSAQRNNSGKYLTFSCSMSYFLYLLIQRLSPVQLYFVLLFPSINCILLI